MKALTTKRTMSELNFQWFTLLLVGIVLTFVGVWTLASPTESYLNLSVAFGFSILAAGVLEMVFSLMFRKRVLTWKWNLAFGGIDLFVGSYLALYPSVTMLLIPYVIGFWMLVRSFLAIGSAIDMRSQKGLRWRLILYTGIITTLLSLTVLSHPIIGRVGIISYIGLSFVAFGIYHIYLSLIVKNWKRNT